MMVSAIRSMIARVGQGWKIEDQNRVVMACAVGLFGVMAVSCGDDSPTAPSGGGTTTLTATLSSIQAQIFSSRCYQCHGSNRREQNLDLQNNAHANIVSRPSGQRPAVMLVAPGNPDQSYLVHKVEGQSTIMGQRMPAGGAALSATEITTIRQWIANGAQNN